RVAVREWGDEIVFLHRIEDGATDRSYGLHVGRLAGIPAPVLERARAILARLEDDGERLHAALATPEAPRARQLSLFESPRERVLRELAQLELDDVSPRQALDRLVSWRDALREGEA